MFREMRRKKQEMSESMNMKVLQDGTSGVLALLGDDDYPYALPINYVFHEGKIYFHSAKSGHKIDAIRGHDKVSFCVTDYEEIVPEKYTAYFRSVIAFGKIRILEKEDEIRHAIEVLAERFFPEDETGRREEIERSWDRLCMIELSVEHMTGKQAIELS